VHWSPCCSVGLNDSFKQKMVQNFDCHSIDEFTNVFAIEIQVLIDILRSRQCNDYCVYQMLVRDDGFVSVLL